MVHRITTAIAADQALNRHQPPGDARLRSLGEFAGANHDQGIC